MFYFLSIIGFIIYGLLVTSLFITALISSISAGHFIVSILKLLVICFLLYELYVEYHHYLRKKRTHLLKKKLSKKNLNIFLGVLIGTICSYLMNHYFALGGVVASSIVGLISGLLMPSLAIPIYCGSFAGMVSNLLAPNIVSAIAIGLMAGLLFVIGSESFKGFGGKLGATASFATLLVSILLGKTGEVMTNSPVNLQYEVLPFILIGSLGTCFLKEKYRVNSVVASSLLGLIAGLLLPNLFANGSLYAITLFCGTFIGMSSTSRQPTWISVTIASLIASIIYLYTSPYSAGLGGKLGLIAFGSTIATAGIYSLKAYLSKKTLHR